MLPPGSHRPSSAVGYSLYRVAEAEFLAGKRAVCPQCAVGRWKGLPCLLYPTAVSNSTNALRLQVTIFSMLDSQTARLWASGSTQQRGDCHINPCNHSVSQVCVHLDILFHFASYSTQQVMTITLASFFLCHFLGQERINSCELH